jgi:hypothetical protein
MERAKQCNGAFFIRHRAIDNLLMDDGSFVNNPRAVRNARVRDLYAVEPVLLSMNEPVE